MGHEDEKILSSSLTLVESQALAVMDNFVSHNMAGVPKEMAERYADYPVSHDQHFYYTYEPAQSHGYSSPSKHHYGGGGHKSNAAMSALTLLAFLFFLHILQQCIKDHMTAMGTSPVVIMSAGKEGNENIGKTRVKLDKTGVTKGELDADAKDNAIHTEDAFDEDKHLLKIPTSEPGFNKFKNIYKRSSYTSTTEHDKK
ncbi:unnamed protein product [Leptosia nina]|uniref:Uncharacterized protein n=1 Tax=Leptosia nina TaxID=320188 RepID=A0AAV1J2I3_9NEOP